MQPPRQELDSVFVGLICLAEAQKTTARLEAGLSDSDRERAERFRRSEDRARFVLGRGLLAAMLREHRGYPAGPLELALTEHGRPFLAADPAVAFSISHAGDIVGVALTTGARLGLDVESLDRRVELGPLAERIFHAADLAYFNRLPTDARHRAFFHAWTGKEAVLKAKGVGLFGGVEEISVPLDGTAATIRDVHEGKELAWHLDPVPVPEGYLGAVARDDARKAVRVRVYTELGP